MTIFAAFSLSAALRRSSSATMPSKGLRGAQLLSDRSFSLPPTCASAACSSLPIVEGLAASHLYRRARIRATPQRSCSPGPAMGLEVIVSKRAGSRYSSGNSRQWLKSKKLVFDPLHVAGFGALIPGTHGAKDAVVGANRTSLRVKSCNETRPSPSRAEASALSPRTPRPRSRCGSSNPLAKPISAGWTELGRSIAVRFSNRSIRSQSATPHR